MIDIRFHLRRKDSGVIVLEFGIAFRLLFAFLALIMGVGMAETGGFAPLPIGFFVILVLGALYEERWEFDPNRQEIFSRNGLIVLARKRRWRFDEVESIEYSHYRAGSIPGTKQTPPTDLSASTEAMSRFGRMSRGAGRHFVRYELALRDGGRQRIELRRIRDWNADKQIPETIAATIGVEAVQYEFGRGPV